MRSAGWSNFYGWRVERRTGTPLSRQIYTQVRGAVLNGVARACVVAAYAQLSTEGYVETRLGSGTIICADLQDLVAAARRRTRSSLARPRLVPAPANAFAEFERSAGYAEGRPFNTGRTLIDARTPEAWRKLTHQAVRSLGAYDLGYTDPAGSIELRASICEYLQADVGTLNKALFPGLRLGYAVVPRAVLAAFAAARYLMDRQPPTLYQAVLAQFMQQGHFAAHVRRMRQM
jgi:DNA-binding transcriptional MocR family regulator